MRIFVTGATGFVGSAVVGELIGAGHQVLGLTRSDAGAEALRAAGAEPVHGATADLDGLKAAAARADAVIHLAFNHDFTNYLANCEDDRRVIAALASELEGTDKPLVITSGTGIAARAADSLIVEDDPAAPSSQTPRAATEEAADAASAAGVDVRIVRLPQVHDTEKQGLISPLIQIALQKGELAYIGEGKSRWSAAHRLDVARLYRLALEKGEPGARYHAVAEEGVTMKAICDTLSRRLGLPEKSIAPDQAGAQFGWMGAFADMDRPASSAKTRQQLGWAPTGPTLLEDLANLKLG